MNNSLIVVFAFCLVVLSLAKPAFAQSSADKKSFFIEKLLQDMTLDEKIGQMTLFTSDWAVTGPTMRDTYKQDIKTGKTGAIFNAYTVDYVRELQRIAVEETRLKIPLIFGYDVIHGHRTIFPITLAQSCSWDLKAVENAARIAASEASAEGLNWTFAPMVDIARDPRWGRIAEGAGEDTYLGSKMAYAQVKGYQGNDLAANNTIVACAKHFAAYGAAEAGKDYNTVELSEHTLRQTYLPPFKACLDAGVKTFMTSFNEISGVPSSANPLLLKKILKEEWGFDGFIVTDYTSINEMVDHGFAENEKHAGELSLNAGVDMDMQGAVFYNYLKQSLDEKKVTMESVNEAVRRILSIKYDLGLFEDPYRYCNKQREQTELMTPQNREAARELCQKSIVLLKNENNVLPLNKSGKIALIGPLADDQRNLIGNWSAAGDWKKAVSVLEGFKNKLGNKATILHAKGANLTDDKDLLKKLNDHGGDIKTDSKTPEQLIEEALVIAKQADVVVMVLGESQGMSGEAAVLSNIDLPASQQRLLRAIHATGKPVVLLLMNGRPLTLSWEHQNIAAIVETWWGGTEAGNGIADVVFGDVNPSGKLTITFPRNVGQIPIYYNAKNTGRPYDNNDKYTAKYLDVPVTPLYPFGHGLSYTQFNYSNLQLSSAEMSASNELKVSVTVSNSGKRNGEEIVQLYIKDHVGSITRPVKELKGFEKIALKAGESKTVTFTLTANDLAFYNAQNVFAAEPGMFTIYVGGSSNTELSASLQLLP